MRGIVLGVFVLVVVGVPGSVQVMAQTSTQAPPTDLARCEHLYAQYTRYSNTGADIRSNPAHNVFEANAAIEDCRKGNTQAGIAVLERKLRSLGFKI